MTDNLVRDLRQLTLTLRGDLRFTAQTHGSQPCYVVEDAINSKFFRIGLAEYTFVSLLDGKTTIADALHLTATAFPDGGFTDQDAAAVCKWLLDNRLTQHDASLEDDTTPRKRKPGWNPISFRLPLFHPDRFFGIVTPCFAWLFGSPLFIVWCGLLGWAGFELADGWVRFTSASGRIFAPDNWLWLIGCWLILKTIHEMAHGIVCKKYGGTVREAGLFFILFTPLAFVDVTSSWRFRSRWQRIFTATAGMYVELAFGAAAVIAWNHTPPGQFNDVCFNVAVMASATTLLFNANPLMRFDGYYILSDLIGIVNLYPSGQQYLNYIGRRHLLGIPATLPHWSRAAGLFIRLYGVAALGWRVVICVGLLVAAATMFHGAGLALAVVAGGLWIIGPVIRMIRYAVRGKPGERPNWLRFTGVSAAAASLLAFVLLVVPWPGSTRAPAIVQYEPLTVVRTDGDAFVKQVYVHGGQHVEAGQLLAVLENDQQAAELTDVELQIEQSRIRSRQHQRKGEIAAFQAEQTNREALQKKHSELRDQLNRLTIHAPRGGEIIGRNLDSLAGTYVEQGTELCSIGDREQQELQISIAQDDLECFSKHIGETLAVRLAGHGVFRCTLGRVDPRATQEPMHAAFCAPLGGPIAVRQKDAESKSSDDTQYEYLAPRFVGHLPLSAQQSHQLRTGQIGFARLHEGQPIGYHLYYESMKWLRERLRVGQRG